MIAFCGYNFCNDINVIDPSPVNTGSIKEIYLQNGVFNHFHAGTDVNTAFSADIPTEWDVNTLLDCNFNGNINAGNTDFIVSNIQQLRIKRRLKGTFTWVTIRIIEVTSDEDLSFTINDNLANTDSDYEYAVVPVLVGGVEGNYISDEIKTHFDGVYICDADSIYRFYAGVKYGNTTKVQKIGTFEPYGRKYPIVVSNSLLGYQKGTVSGNILQPDYDVTRAIDRIACVKYRDQLLDFLVNKKAKIIKDWNGKEWLCMVVDNPSVSYNSSIGMALANVSFNYVELGDANNENDLISTGIVKQVTL